MRNALWVALMLIVGAALLPWTATAQDRPVDAARAPDPTRRNLDSYRLRVGDQVEVVVYNGRAVSPDMTRQLTVPGNGEVSFPPVGKVELLDRTVFEVQTQIEQKLKDEDWLKNPGVGVVVTKFEPRTVFLIGAVQGEVPLPVHKELRILEVLARAGSLGFGQADLSRITVRRFGKDGVAFPIVVNVDAIIHQNKQEQNIVIREGDLIILPPLEEASPQSADWVYVLGKVKTPGRQPILKGRTPFTLTKLIAMCGDFQEFADRSKVKIIRTTPTGRVPITIDFDDIIEMDRPDVELQPDDLIYVPESWI